jgi:hypothetical protein
MPTPEDVSRAERLAEQAREEQKAAATEGPAPETIDYDAVTDSVQRQRESIDRTLDEKNGTTNQGD